MIHNDAVGVNNVWQFVFGGFMTHQLCNKEQYANVQLPVVDPRKACAPGVRPSNGSGPMKFVNVQNAKFHNLVSLALLAIHF